MGLYLHVHMLLHSSNSFGVALRCTVHASDGEFRTTSQKVCAILLEFSLCAALCIAQVAMWRLEAQQGVASGGC